MSKSRAALNHLWLTLLALTVLAAVILFVWYPHPFRQFGDSAKFALLLMVTAAFIGPALTFLVYKKDKRGLLLDLCVISLVQIAALGWGAFSLYQNRPYFMVYTVDRFEVLSQRDVDLSWVTDPKFLNKPIAGPILLYANMPADPAAYQQLLKEVMFEGKPDLQFRPEFWSLYSERQQAVLHKSQALADLRSARLDSTQEIDQLVQTHGNNIDKLRFVPALFKDGHFTVILNTSSGDVIDTLVIDPWLQ